MPFLHIRDHAEREVIKRAVKESSTSSLAAYAQWFWPVLHSGWESDGKPVEPLKRDWYFDAMCVHLEAVTAGEISRLVINIPPGHAKTKVVFTYWSSWEYGPKNLTHLKRIYCSATADFAMRENNTLRKLMTSREFSACWDLREDCGQYDADAASQFAISGGGQVYAVGIDGQITGKRCHRLIIDDPNLPRDIASEKADQTVRERYSGTLSSRRILGATDYGEVLIQQRLSLKDLTAYVKSLEFDDITVLNFPLEYEPHRVSYSRLSPSAPDRKDWVKLIGKRNPGPFPEPVRYAEIGDNGVTITEEDFKAGRFCDPDQEAAFFDAEPDFREGFKVDMRTERGEILSPKLFSEKSLSDLKQAAGGENSAFYRAQYQQSPRALDSTVFETSKLVFVDKIPELIGPAVRGWDIAYGKKDKTASVKMAAVKGKIIVLDVTGWNKPIGDNERFARAMVESADGRDVIQDIPEDPGQAGSASVASWRRVFSGYRVFSSRENRNKLSRSLPFACRVNGGEVLVLRAPWNREFIAALDNFTEKNGGSGPQDDYVDAASRAFSRAAFKNKGLAVICAPRLIDKRV